jgi:hypothetical protein
MPHFDNDPGEPGSFVRRNSRHLNVVIYVFHAILAGDWLEVHWKCICSSSMSADEHLRRTNQMIAHRSRKHNTDHVSYFQAQNPHFLAEGCGDEAQKEPLNTLSHGLDSKRPGMEVARR